MKNGRVYLNANRHGVYCYRRGVRSHPRPYFPEPHAGKRELTQTLETKDERIANSRMNPVEIKMERIYVSASNMGKIMAFPLSLKCLFLRNSETLLPYWVLLLRKSALKKPSDKIFVKVMAEERALTKGVYPITQPNLKPFQASEI